jgi:hypothetical protein
MTELTGQVKPGEVYRFLTTFYMYNDGLGWKRTQLMVAVEGGVLAGAFAKSDPWSAIILFFGTPVIWPLFQLILRAWEIRDQHLELLDQVDLPMRIRMTKTSKSTHSANHVLKFLVWMMIVANLTLAFVFLFWPSLISNRPTT